MVNEATIDLASLRFDGKRLEERALDVKCAPDFVACRTLVSMRMRQRGLTDALAHDHHFEQAAFVALLR